jgi:hypothetical protein
VKEDNDNETFTAFEDYCNEIAAANKAWHERWPQACKTCEGAGGFHYPGDRENPPDWDTCTCIEEAKCPRCGFCNWDEDNEAETPCIKCGWNWGKGPDDAAPQV